MKNGYTLSGARILFVSLIFGLCFVGEARGQSQLAKWDFENTLVPTGVDANTTASNVTISDGTIGFQAGADDGGSTIGNASSWPQVDFSTSGKYLQFTITPNSGFTINFDSITLRFGRTSVGPTRVTAQYSLDGFATAGTTMLDDAEVTSTSTSSLNSFSISSGSLPSGDRTETLTVRIWGHNASGTGNLRFNNFVVNGVVEAIPGAGPAITHTPLGNTTSTSARTATATITGNNLVTADGNRPAIWFRVDGGSFTFDYFTSQDGDDFEFTIPGQDVGSTVDYYIAAADEDGVTTHPAGGSGENPPGSTAPGNFHTYDVEVAPGLRTWTGLGDAVSWNDAENWDPEVVPGEGDDVLLDNSEVAGSYTVFLPSGEVETTIQSLTITPGDPEAPITVELPVGNTNIPGLSITGAGDALVLNDGGVFRNSSGAESGTGVVVTNNTRINDGGRFIHRRTGGTAALMDSISDADAAESGVLEFDVPGSGSFSIALTGRTLGTLEFSDAEDDGRTYSVTGGSVLTVRGNLVLRTGFTANVPIMVSRTLDLVDGTLTIQQPEDRPFTLASSEDRIATITNGAGTVDGAITYERFYKVENSGWRMISSPFSDVNYSSLNDNFHTQGGAWARGSAGVSNLQFYTPAVGPWVEETGPDAAFDPGMGFIFYMYKDDAEIGGTDTFLPGKWIISGNENADEVTRSELAPGFHLVGNPFAGNMDWHAILANNGTENVTTTYHVWDPDNEVGGGADGYKFYNATGQSGDAGQFIAPFQGFFVESQTAAGEIQFLYANKENQETPVYFGKREIAGGKAPQVRLELANDRFRSTQTYLVFAEDAHPGRDPYDVIRLHPLSSNFATLLFTGDHDYRFAVDGRSLAEELEEYNLHVATTAAGSYTISWPEWYEIPDHWTFTLTDNKTGTEVDLRAVESYTFDVATPLPLGKTDEPQFGQIAASAPVDDPRFTLIVSSRPVPTEPGADLPATFALHAAYPNPFNPATQIAYDVPEHTFVRVAVYDAVGRQVAVLAAHEHAAGEHRLTWNAAGMASGLYFVRMETAGRVMTRSVTLLR